jgi:hypothetical protein
MSRRYHSAFRILGLIGASLIWTVNGLAQVVVSGSFGPNGDVGFANSPMGCVTGPPCPTITFGADSQGLIYQMDGFVNASNTDWSGPSTPSGTSRQLTDGPPTGVGYTFTAVQPTTHQLLLTYQFVNNTAQTLTNFQFMYYADPDIGSNFADEWATVAGSPGFGLTSYQVSDPTFSSMFTNLDNGTLNNTNEEPITSPGDVSTALGFKLVALGIGENATFQVLMSDDLSSIGSLSVTQQDSIYADTLTLSGRVVTPQPAPEPSSLVLYATGLVLLAVALGKRYIA